MEDLAALPDADRKSQRLLSQIINLQFVRSDCSLLSSMISMPESNLAEKDSTQQKKKRKFSIDIGTEEDIVFENFTAVQKQKTLLDQHFISKSLENHFIFSSLLQNEEIASTLVQKFELCTLQRDQYLMDQNDDPSAFFILNQGVMAVEIDGKEKNRLYPGTGFGEIALLHSKPRSASIKALKDCQLWYINRKTFQQFASSIMKKKFHENLQFIKGIQFFALLTTKQKNKLASIVKTHKYDQNRKVFHSGTMSNEMLIVKSGRLKQSIRGYSFRVLKKGDTCAEFAVLDRNSIHRETLTATQASEVLSFCAEDFEKVLGKSLPVVIVRNMARAKLNSYTYFNCLSNEYLNKIIDTFQVRKVYPNEVMVYPGLPMRDMIFFIIQGNFLISNTNKISEVYGCDSLKKQPKSITYDFHLHFISQGKIAFTSVTELERNLACSFRDLQLKKYNSPQISNEYFVTQQNHKQFVLKERSCIEMENDKSFQIIAKIGEGHFGTVFKAFVSQKNKFYALKVVPKKKEILKPLQNEKNILQKVINPFVVDYYGFFEDESLVYFVLEFIEGVELFTALRSLGLLKTSETRFYCAILFQVLKSMHKMNIIYRDLKPENIMLETNGYLKVIDLGTAKVIEGVQRTFTIIGTPSYMAPEVVLGQGYSYEADFWSLGVIMFELLSGYLPFGEHLEDPYLIFQQIISGKLELPERVSDEDACNLIRRLLNRKPHQRLLGCYSTIKNHPFFQSIDWNQLLNKKIQPFYYIPSEKCTEDLMDKELLKQFVRL